MSEYKQKGSRESIARKNSVARKPNYAKNLSRACDERIKTDE